MTGTVESIPLISASIMSKKIAEGIAGLVLDVKSGRGAFMKTRTDARASPNRSSGWHGQRRAARRRSSRRWTRRSGARVGNALEVIECIETLKGNGPGDLTDLSVLLAARMVNGGRPGRRVTTRPNGRFARH